MFVPFDVPAENKLEGKHLHINNGKLYRCQAASRYVPDYTREVPTTLFEFVECRFYFGDANGSVLHFERCIFTDGGNLPNYMTTYENCLFTGSPYAQPRSGDTFAPAPTFKDCAVDNVFSSWSLAFTSVDGLTVSGRRFGLHITGSDVNNVVVIGDCDLEVQAAQSALNYWNVERDWDFLACDDSQLNNIHVGGRLGRTHGNLVSCSLDNVTIDGEVRVNLYQCKARRSTIKVVKMSRVRCKVCKKWVARDTIYLKGICNQCSARGLYSEPNGKIVGRRSKHPTFSIEFEIQRLDEDDESTHEGDAEPIELLQFGFTRNSDGSVDDEYKSPIYRDMRHFEEVLPLLDELADFVGPNCGTHVHVGFNPDIRGRLRRHWAFLFGGIESRMSQRTRETVAFWGRYFTDYASVSTSTGNRQHWVNLVSNKPTVEWRLCKFDHAKQYRAVVVFVREVSEYLDKELAVIRTAEELEGIRNTLNEMYNKAVNASLVNA